MTTIKISYCWAIYIHNIGTLEIINVLIRLLHFDKFNTYFQLLVRSTWMFVFIIFRQYKVMAFYCILKREILMEVKKVQYYKSEWKKGHKRKIPRNLGNSKSQRKRKLFPLTSLVLYVLATWKGQLEPKQIIIPASNILIIPSLNNSKTKLTNGQDFVVLYKWT